mmetsp:Transcript_2654/g.4112  ORF Transcript_2654/g.4112 Transcript_2654/m.4112 type:complete len:90 (-) Transcript_2654:165-434(-)
MTMQDSPGLEIKMHRYSLEQLLKLKTSTACLEFEDAPPPTLCWQLLAGCTLPLNPIVGVPNAKLHPMLGHLSTPADAASSQLCGSLSQH